jgi:hypothetical protein
MSWRRRDTWSAGSIPLAYVRTSTPAEVQAEEARRERELRALFVQGPCYGVADWPGTSALGGWSSGGKRFRSIELTFAAADESRGSITVVTVVADRLTIEIGDQRGRADDLDPPHDYEALAAEPAEEVVVAVEGRPVPFRLWRHGSSQVAAAPSGERGIVLAIRDVDPASIRLSPIDDFGPFLDGARALAAKHRDGAG